MDPLFISLLIGAVLLGAVPPLFKPWSDRGLHVFVSLAAGMFLGALFLHLLPEMTSAVGAGDHGHDSQAHQHGATAPWIAALAGLLLMFLIERFWGERRAGGPGHKARHASLFLATSVGLSLHAFVTGVALGGVDVHDVAGTAFLLSFAVHKASEGFSLASVGRLAHVEPRRLLLTVAVFACVTPAGVLLASGLAATGGRAEPVLMGASVGTFLYMAVGNLLPEVFHEPEHRSEAIVALLIGVLLASVGIPHVEGHL